eukprot:10161891-Prorocentrum_lima.AAC.1
MPESAICCSAECSALCGCWRLSRPVPAAKRSTGRQSPQHLAVSPAAACCASSLSPHASP